MNEITYLGTIKEETYPNGQKPAKISPEKIIRLKSNYKSNLKAVTPVVQTPVTPQAPIPVVGEVASAPVSVQSQPVVAPVVTDNYDEVVNDNKMATYEKSFDELPLTGARKIRITFKLPKHIKGCRKKTARGKLENAMPVVSAPLVEEKMEPIVNNVVETPKVQSTPVVNEPVVRENVSPSVDDYLQKEVPGTNSNELIKQQEEKNASLRAEKEAKEKKLQQMRYEKEQRQQQIILEQLREEELGLTMAIKGIDADILREEAEMVSMGHKK